MKPSVFNRISSGVFLACMFVTIILFLRFFYVSFTRFVDEDSTEISALLYWIFFLLIITFSTGIVFSFYYYIRQWKEKPGKVRYVIAIVVAWGLLLLITWLLGNGNPLPLPGYKGTENTYLWLKLTDMWLYSIYILLGVGFFALVGGIIWSYFKK